MRLFREICGVRIGLPATNWMLEIGAFVLRTETELLIKSRRVVPGRLLAAGFDFYFAHLHDALRELESRMRGHDLRSSGGRTCGTDTPAHT
jgi:NAD dependent epimerase/dehydratase family enzyme